MKPLTEEQIQRRAVLRKRIFWLLVGFDVLLVIYLIVQVALLFKYKNGPLTYSLRAFL